MSKNHQCKTLFDQINAVEKLINEQSLIKLVHQGDDMTATVYIDLWIFQLNRSKDNESYFVKFFFFVQFCFLRAYVEDVSSGPSLLSTPYTPPAFNITWAFQVLMFCTHDA